jgi:hypothetical protein
MEAFLPDPVKLILVGLLAIALAFGGLARALPGVGWLQVFRPTILVAVASLVCVGIGIAGLVRNR